MDRPKPATRCLGLSLLLLLFLFLTACAPATGQPEPGLTPPASDATATSAPPEPAPATPTTLPEPAPTETPPPPAQPTPTTAAEALCPEAPRPALVVKEPNNEAIATVVGLDGEALCELLLQAAPRYQLIGAAGSLFYDVVDEASQTATVWRLDPDGTNRPLSFTATDIRRSGIFTFLVSPDGSTIVWGTATPDVARVAISLSVAGIDGENQRPLLEGLERGNGAAISFAQPLRFSPDNQTLFYALRTDWKPPIWSVVTGHYIKLYSIPLEGGDPTLLFDCESIGLDVCLGDIAPDGSALAYTDPQQAVYVVDNEGQHVATLAVPAGEYVGPALFSPSGTLAFASATVKDLDGFPVPAPGTISTVAAPYTAEPETVVSMDGIATLVRWVDDSHLVYFDVPNAAENGMAIVSTAGDVSPISVNLNSLASFVAVLDD